MNYKMEHTGVERELHMSRVLDSRQIAYSAVRGDQYRELGIDMRN